MILAVHETPYEKITFEDRLRRDFELYEGSWTLQKSDGGVWINYKLKVRSALLRPAFLERGILEGSISAFMREVRKEIVRRGNI
mgnify:CR=1 FL=1